MLTAAIASFACAAPALAADQGSVEILAIAPAFCRVTSISQAPASADGNAAFGTVRRACNTVNDARITAQVSNLDSGALRLGHNEVALSASGAATLSPEQLADLSDLHLVNARPTDARAPVAVELTITPQ
jgi:hypothetical protein